MRQPPRLSPPLSIWSCVGAALGALLGACSSSAPDIRCDTVGACKTVLTVETILPLREAELEGVSARICSEGGECKSVSYVSFSRDPDSETCVGSAGYCRKPEFDAEGRARISIEAVVPDLWRTCEELDCPATFTVTFARNGAVLREATKTVTFTSEPATSGSCGPGCPEATFTL